MKLLKFRPLLKRFMPLSIQAKLAKISYIKQIRYWLGINIFLVKKLKSQLGTKNILVAGGDKFHGVRVLLPLIETSHYQYYQLIVLAKALELRGAQVKVLVCDGQLDGCEIKSVKNSNESNPCSKCQLNIKKVLPLFGLQIIKLSDVFSKKTLEEFGVTAKRLVASELETICEYGIDLKQSIEDSVVRYYYGAVPVSSEIVNEVREKHTNTALMAIKLAKYFDETWSPNIVLSGMASYSAWEPYYRYFTKYGKRFRQISLSQFNFKSVVFNSFELFPAFERFKKYMEKREGDCRLNEQELQLLYSFINRRHSGKSDIFTIDKYFSNNEISKDVASALALNKSKRNIFLFSNLYWDVGLSDRKGLFDGVLAWVETTIEILKDLPNCHLYVKPHPAEVFGSTASLRGVSEIIKKNYPGGISNLTVIEPEWKLLPYNCFPHIDLGVVFTGTLGLEMALADIPVVSTGMTSHRGLGITAEPDSIESYRAMLLGEVTLPKVDKDYLEMFAYFYFIRTLIPWTLTKQAYADNFDGFSFNELEDLFRGKDKYLDHLCDCILDSHNTVPEAYP